MSSGARYNIAKLVEHLKSDNAAHRLHSVCHISIISIALGPERTKEELLSFLHERIQIDTDEICIALAEQIPTLSKLVGDHDDIKLLLPLLESLASSESLCVQESATRALAGMAHLLAIPSFAAEFNAVVDRLLAAPWYNRRAAGVALVPVAAAVAASTRRRELAEQLIAATAEDFPAVRKEAARALPATLEAVEGADLLLRLAAAALKLADDESGGVRIVNATNLPLLIDALDDCADVPPESEAPMQATRADLFERFLAGVDDSMSCVRAAVARGLPGAARLCPTVGGCSLDRLAKLFLRLAADKEESVRAEAVRAMPRFVEAELRAAAGLPATVPQVLDADALLGEDSDVGAALGPALKAASTLLADLVKGFDTRTPGLRALFVQKLCETARVIGSKLAAKRVLPVVREFLHDTFLEVGLAALAAAPHVLATLAAARDAAHAEEADALKMELVDAFAPLVDAYAWRIRLGALGACEDLAEALGEEVASDSLLPLVLRSLGDTVCAVRAGAGRALAALAGQFGDEWFEARVLPELEALADDTNYLRRVSLAQMLENAADAVSESFLREKLFPVLCTLAHDAVSNVRIAATATLAQYASRVGCEFAEEAVLPLLRALTSDADSDVAAAATAIVASA
eukprot:gnl/Chilomastix_cuspidata/2737.p2 GENE.gnl/Chilomastix_cuspidata/2737~~gnl/Chilomastix_cuspidata/2737.p2  ORF type:complete len:636 (-),score=321.24 gnl/Chilomastix_cuspidata/2737:1433-3340(-)